MVVDPWQEGGNGWADVGKEFKQLGTEIAISAAVFSVVNLAQMAWSAMVGSHMGIAPPRPTAPRSAISRTTASRGVTQYGNGIVSADPTILHSSGVVSSYSSSSSGGLVANARWTVSGSFGSGTVVAVEGTTWTVAGESIASRASMIANSSPWTVTGSFGSGPVVFAEGTTWTAAVSPIRQAGSFGGLVAGTAEEAAFLNNAAAAFGDSSVFTSATRFQGNVVIQRSDIPFSIQNVRRMAAGNTPFVRNSFGEWEKLNLHHVGRQDGKLIEILNSHNAYNQTTGGPLHIPGPGSPIRDATFGNNYWMQRLQDGIKNGSVPRDVLRKWLGGT